ncbi:hypothetical protein [Thermomonospora cellulosilytica]|uniref:Uncharacterized protein n=1 Tax=Thermomonospora cellulosilytica TaxID=1411118 RepID=A0A7W3N1R1_9ACTN|nr:hypothetical protein [Thermomonospora cellulosilytica]MBA9005892.1 hypothetical protein [Thermomonospora cellulosilytica]
MLDRHAVNGEDLVTAARAEHQQATRYVLQITEPRHYDGVATEDTRAQREGLQRFITDMTALLGPAQL